MANYLMSNLPNVQFNVLLILALDLGCEREDISCHKKPRRTKNDFQNTAFGGTSGETGYIKSTLLIGQGLFECLVERNKFQFKLHGSLQITRVCVFLNLKLTQNDGSIIQNVHLA